VVSKVNYCNSVLAGVSDTQLQQLQSVLNVAARLVFLARRSERNTPLLSELHWLTVPERIKFQLCVLTFRCIHGTVPRYHDKTMQLKTSRCSRSRLRSADTSTLIVQLHDDGPFEIARFQMRLPMPSSVREVQ